jgi:hypothetical protein
MVDEIDRKLIEVYRSTRYCVQINGEQIVVRIGEKSPPLDDWLQAHDHRSWAIITACNPMSRELPEAENARRQQLLEEVLSVGGYSWLEAENMGEDGAWAEASLFVTGADIKYIEALGVAFQQYAVVTGGVGGAAELLFL